MNREYKKRIKYAYEAAKTFFEIIERNGDVEMLQNDDHIRALYLKAHDAAGRSTEEERNFYLEYSIFFEYKTFLMVASGEFAKIMADKTTFTATELTPIYNSLTQVMDDAIAQNDKYKPYYLKNKEQIISEYNDTLEKFGFTVE